MGSLDDLENMRGIGDFECMKGSVHLECMGHISHFEEIERNRIRKSPIIQLEIGCFRLRCCPARTARWPMAALALSVGFLAARRSAQMLSPSAPANLFQPSAVGSPGLRGSSAPRLAAGDPHP
nr:hypothetical protein Itr_chr03CG04000 [Ipomoea trifida]